MGSGGGGKVPANGGGLYGKYTPVGVGMYPAGGGYDTVWDGGVVVVDGVVGVTEPEPVGGG
jgi:hypothetical protein